MTPTYRIHQHRERSLAMSAHPDQRAAVSAFIAGAAGTTIAGTLVQILIIPNTEVSDDRWSYPWEAGPFVAISLAYAFLHLLVAAGLVAFGRIGVAGASRSARGGIALTVAGTLTLTAGEFAGLAIRNERTGDTTAQVVGAVFGLGVVLSAVGLILVGIATLRAHIWQDWRRYTPLATGICTAVLVVIPIANPQALPAGVAIYGAGLLTMAWGLHPMTRMPEQPLHPAV